MRELGVQNLIAFCHNDACRHQALIDVSSYPAETEVAVVPATRVKCGNNRRRPHSSLDGIAPDQAYFDPLPFRAAA
jgi:hypothetical protein